MRDGERVLRERCEARKFTGLETDLLVDLLGWTTVNGQPVSYIGLEPQLSAVLLIEADRKPNIVQAVIRDAIASLLRRLIGPEGMADVMEDPIKTLEHSLGIQHASVVWMVAQLHLEKQCSGEVISEINTMALLAPERMMQIVSPALCQLLG